MPLRLEIQICDRGSITIYHEGDLSLLTKQSGCVEKMIGDLVDAANLGVATRPQRDSIVERVRRKLLDRSQAGIAKYGVTLERDDVDMAGWLTHLQEELLDGANYCERLLDEQRRRCKDADADS